MMPAAFSKLVAACAVVAVAATVGVASVAADSGASPCSAADMSGLFYAIQGSAGAGQITYALRLRNRSIHACFVSGLPRLQLLGRTGKLLPTRVWPAHPGALATIRVVLAPGKYAVATARFSPTRRAWASRSKGRASRRRSGRESGRRVAGRDRLSCWSVRRRPSARRAGWCSRPSPRWSSVTASRGGRPS